MSDTVSAFCCTSENMHPFECDGRGKCIHCDERKTENHDPAKCALCQYERLSFADMEEL